MPIRIIDIHQDHRYLHRKRGFMVVSHKDEELGRIPLDDIAAVIASGHGITHSSNLLAALAERCLLYTSPSPRDLSTSRMPSSA